MIEVDEDLNFSVRSYKHVLLELTDVKDNLLLTLLIEYRRVADIMMSKQINHFFRTGKLNEKSKDFYGNIQTFLTERYKDVIKRQIDGMLKSYISNRKNDFVDLVSSNFKGKNNKKSIELKKELYTINRLNKWFDPENLIARKIFKHILKKNKFPSVKHINMVLNTKAYCLEENKVTKSCDYIVRLRTCNTEHKNIYLPLKRNTYLSKELKKNYKINNSIQINFDKNNKIKCVVLSCSKKKFKTLNPDYKSSTASIALDFGLRNLFTTNLGDMFSKNFIDKLTVYDKKILKLQKEIQKRKQKLSENKKYKDLTHRLRAFIKNESNRVINRLIKVHKPGEIVVELLNFEGVNLSKRMNRLLSNCGLANIKAKLMCVSEDYGIKITYVNPAYTSQECSVCHHTEKDNRKTREKFECLCCGHKALADVNATKNIMSRAHDDWFTSNPYATKESIKQHLLYKNKMFVNTNSRLSKAVECKTSSPAILS